MIINQNKKFKHLFNLLTHYPITEQHFFSKFLELYPEDWKQLKINYAKFNRSKRIGKTIPLQKPEQYLKKEIRVWLKKRL